MSSHTVTRRLASWAWQGKLLIYPRHRNMKLHLPKDVDDSIAAAPQSGTFARIPTTSEGPSK